MVDKLKYLKQELARIRDEILAEEERISNQFVNKNIELGEYAIGKYFKTVYEYSDESTSIYYRTYTDSKCHNCLSVWHTPRCDEFNKPYHLLISTYELESIGADINTEYNNSNAVQTEITEEEFYSVVTDAYNEDLKNYGKSVRLY